MVNDEKKEKIVKTISIIIDNLTITTQGGGRQKFRVKNNLYIEIIFMTQ